MGQTCVCANRIYVQSSVYAEFASRLAEEVASFKVGNGLDESTTHGPLIHARALEKVQAHVDDAVKLDAQVLVGGTSIPGTAFFNPTVLSDIPTSARINSEEMFGPLAALINVGLTGYSAAAFLALPHTQRDLQQLCPRPAVDVRVLACGYACPAVDVRVLACGYARPAGDVGVSVCGYARPAGDVQGLGVQVRTSSWGHVGLGVRVHMSGWGRAGMHVWLGTCGSRCAGTHVQLWMCGSRRAGTHIQLGMSGYACPAGEVRVSVCGYARPAGDVRVCTSSCERAGLGVQYLKETDQFDSSFTTSYKPPGDYESLLFKGIENSGSGPQSIPTARDISPAEPMDVDSGPRGTKRAAEDGIRRTDTKKRKLAGDVWVSACGYTSSWGRVGLGVQVCTSGCGRVGLSVWVCASGCGHAGMPSGSRCAGMRVRLWTCEYVCLAVDMRVSVCGYTRPGTRVRVSVCGYAHPGVDVWVLTCTEVCAGMAVWVLMCRYSLQVLACRYLRPSVGVQVRTCGNAGKVVHRWCDGTSLTIAPLLVLSTFLFSF
ncbi:hypothetical protein B0H14DRAFT_3903738 [Mycena olivaceomarginata]|nr:hypothetical protein B0H14DRAFT_3903738 [Mycena olivaceomarginata]